MYVFVLCVCLLFFIYNATVLSEKYHSCVCPNFGLRNLLICILEDDAEDDAEDEDDDDDDDDGDDGDDKDDDERSTESTTTRMGISWNHMPFFQTHCKHINLLFTQPTCRQLLKISLNIIICNGVRKNNNDTETNILSDATSKKQASKKETYF